MVLSAGGRPYTRSLSNRTPVLSWRSSAWVIEPSNAPLTRIIELTGYDTDNAELLGEVTFNGARTDLRWWSAGLYRIPRAGCYFLAGEGNSMTGWRRRVDGGGWAEGQGIVPMNLKEAREWAERCLTTAQVEAAFGDHIEDA